MIVTASNCCKSQLKKSWRKKQVAFNADVHDIGKEESDNLLIQMVKELEEKYRLPVYLFYFEGYSSAEIAKMLHVSDSTVRSRLAKARKLLRLELEAEEKPVKISKKRFANHSEESMRKAW